MAKKINQDFDTMDVKAKKKKTFLIVGIIIILISIIVISLVSTILSTDSSALYEKKRQHQQTDNFKVIQNPEFKETWAISIDNRIEEQQRLIQSLIQEQSSKQDRFISGLKEVLESNQRQNESNIKNMGEATNAKIAALKQELFNQLKIQDEKIKQIEVVARQSTPAYKGSNTDLVIGSNFAPKKQGDGLGGGVIIVVPFKSSGTDEQKQLIIDQNGTVISNTTGMAPEAFIASESNITDENVELPLLDPELPKRKNIQVVSVDNSFNEALIQAQQDIDNEVAEASTKEDLQKNNYHLSTGLTQAYMLTGAYAPAFQEGESDPLPVLFEAEGNIIQPNDHLGSADKCFLIGSAKGNMNSQTAEIKLVKLSCLFQEGTYRIEADIKGWAIGENGMPGVPGELLHKNGAWLARTFVAGFLETFSQALANQNTTTINFGTNTGQTVSENAKSAAAGGLATVFGKLGEYYLKMAEQIFPVIEVRGGRTIDLLLLGGENFAVVENQLTDVDAIDTYLGSKAYEDKTKANDTTIGNSKNAFTRSVTQSRDESQQKGLKLMEVKK
ncbi:TraB/VirB10 family protein [Campylobacter sp. MOP7]|uniref:TraB/VirB10 family protein n=1 Tax=Campylobacter canis TaxID=3378588 RepID=UPI00387EDC2D